MPDLKLVGEPRIALLCGDGDGERDQVQPAPDCLVDRPQTRLMIAGDQQLELRSVLEKILSHEARGDLIAAGQRLDLALGPTSAFFGFHGGHKAGTAQSG